MSDNNIFYVYLHIRLDNNQVFYIGKGSGNRYKGRNGRNRYWHSIVDKVGYRYEILKDFLTEVDAFNLEVDTIKSYRDAGYKLANFTDGGEGVSGYVPTRETLEKLKIIAGAKKRRVWSSDGRTFDGLSDAARAMRSEGFLNASAAGVMASCQSETRVAYDMRWSYFGIPIHNGETSTNRVHKSKSRKVLSSDGLEFDSTREAARWLRLNGYPNALHNPVARACRDDWRFSYGRKWSYIT